MKKVAARSRFTLREWDSLTAYQRFESLIAIALTCIVTVVTTVALFRLLVEVVNGWF
jgi:hypothetical protein